MVTAYVMIKTLTGEADRIRDSIADMEGVIDVHIVAGDVDLIAKIDVETPAAVKDVAARTREVEGVDTTQTYIAMD